jgi:hypothetical protein
MHTMWGLTIKQRWPRVLAAVDRLTDAAAPWMTDPEGNEVCVV